MNKNWKKVITNKKILSIIVVAIILIIILVLLLITFNTNKMISKTDNEKKQEQEQELECEWEVAHVEGDIYGLLIVFRNIKGIKEIHYPKQNDDEEETIVYVDGKYKVAIDYNVEKSKPYQFDVKFEDETTKTYEVTYTPPPPSIELGGETHTAKQIQYTWEELHSIAKFISDNYGLGEGQINNDTVEIKANINGKADTLGIGDWTTVNGKQVRILGFNHDELVTTTTDEDGNEQTTSQYGAGTTNVYAGISFEFVDCFGTAQMHNTAYMLEGWGACNLRRTLNSTTYNSLENKEYIKEVKKQYIKKRRRSR